MVLAGILGAARRPARHLGAGDASDGVEAVEVCVRLRPDVVLMDVRMPRRDGLWAAQQVIGSGAAPRS